jgi:Transposase domain (DUF772)
MNRIRSSRRLERETHRNVELLWLLRKLHPDFKTIADFRKDNAKAFKQVFRAFTLLCKAWGRFGAELLAVDGSKFKAVNNKRRNFTQAKRNETLKAIDAKLEDYLHALDAADETEADVQKPPQKPCESESGNCVSGTGVLKGSGKRWRAVGKAK